MSGKCFMLSRQEVEAIRLYWKDSDPDRLSPWVVGAEAKFRAFPPPSAGGFEQ